MHGVKLIVSDSHAGLKAAREATLPGVPWQRCQMHLQQNALKQITKKSLQYEVTSEIREIFNAPTLENAQTLLAELIKKYEKTQSKLADWLEENLFEGFTVFAFPKEIRQFLRSNNITENINKQIKRRTNLIPVFRIQIRYYG